MAQFLDASMPPRLDLVAPYVIQWIAVDPTTGDAVTGVVISNAILTVTQVTPGGPEALQVGPFMLVPGPGA